MYYSNHHKKNKSDSNPCTDKLTDIEYLLLPDDEESYVLNNFYL